MAFNPFDPLGLFERFLHPTNPDDVKGEFGEPCSRAYNTALENLRLLAGAHDIRRVMEALRRDLGI